MPFDFGQWFVVPDDQPVLTPVDEDIFGLKDFASLQIPNDLWIDQNELSSGLLLGPDVCHNLCHGADTLDAIALSPNTEQNASLPTSDSPSTYASLFPPALSPDSSPNSVASSPWLRTPENTSLANAVANFTPVNSDSLWNIAEIEEGSSCSTVHFLDQSGNSLEDITSHVQDVMPEDIACTPQTISKASLPSVRTATPCTPLPNTPTFVLSPPGASTSSRTETVPLGQAHCMSLPPSPQISQSRFGFSQVPCYPQETGPGACSTSPTLSPLSTLSFFSQSPSAPSNPSPLSQCFLLSPAFSTVSLSNSDEKVDVIGSVSSTSTGVTSALRAKRNAGTLDDDEEAPLPYKIPRRSKAKNVDEEEWSPVHERLKRPRAASSSQSTRQRTPTCPPDESSDCSPNRGPGEHSDTTRTSCEICGKVFTRTSDLTRHIENSSSHPETRKVWPCPHCDSPLSRKDALMRHVKTRHPEKPAFIPEGIPGNQLAEGQKEPFKQPMGQRKMTSRRQARKDMRRYR